jgi:cytochrome c biogenesis protein CcmG/thiol:disulfide interchange protein DsbE
MRWRTVLPVAVFAALATIFAVSLIQVQFMGKDIRSLPSALLYKPAPAFDLPAPDGFEKGLKTGDLAGKVSLVNIFATWCGPCRIEHPALMQLSHDPAILLVGINYRDDPKKLKAWLDRDGNPFARIGFDPKGVATREFGITGVPETYLVDKKGVVRLRWAGAITPTVLREQILPAIEALKQE